MIAPLSQSNNAPLFSCSHFYLSFPPPFFFSWARVAATQAILLYNLKECTFICCFWHPFLQRCSRFGQSYFLKPLLPPTYFHFALSKPPTCFQGNTKRHRNSFQTLNLASGWIWTREWPKPRCHLSSGYFWPTLWGCFELRGCCRTNSTSTWRKKVFGEQHSEIFTFRTNRRARDGKAREGISRSIKDEPETKQVANKN